VNVSTPKAAGKRTKAKPTKKSTKSNNATQGSTVYPSTILTSPLAPQKRHATSRSSKTSRQNNLVDSSFHDDEDAFEPVKSRNKARERPYNDNLGPPITTDERMEALSELHRVYVVQFVDEAKKKIESIRNSQALRKSFFTEAHLREMAIDWTVRLQDMRSIPGIDKDAVDRWGEHLIPIVKQFSENYNDAEGPGDFYMDPNPGEAINLDSEDEEFSDPDVDFEETLSEAEQGSKYFQKPAKPFSNNQATRGFPQNSARGKPTATKRSGKGGAAYPYRGKGRGGRKSGGRKSNGSTSGQSGAGISKRKISGGPKKSTGDKSSTASKKSNIMKSFGTSTNHGGNGGGGMGGGIGMMPT